MAEGEDYEGEWKEKYKVWKKKREEFLLASLQLEKAGRKRIDYFKNETEEIPYKTQKMKTRDKTKNAERELYNISDEAERLSSGDIMDKLLKDIEKRLQVYKSSETRNQKGGR